VGTCAVGGWSPAAGGMGLPSVSSLVDHGQSVSTQSAMVTSASEKTDILMLHLRCAEADNSATARYHAASSAGVKYGMPLDPPCTAVSRRIDGPVPFAERQVGVTKPESIFALRCAGPRP
jgi:hypothetical protein